MKEYYYYWERRTYNALIKMILRARSIQTPKLYPKILESQYIVKVLGSHVQGLAVLRATELGKEIIEQR